MNSDVESIDTMKSCSIEQVETERYLADQAEKWLGIPLERNKKVPIAEGIHIEPDILSEQQKIVGEIYAHIGTLKGKQPGKIAQDILKMLLLEKTTRTTYRKIIIVVNDTVEKQLKGRFYLAENIRQFGIEVKKIELERTLLERVKNAQKWQIMR